MTGVFASLVRCYVGCAAGSADMQSLLVLECDTLSGEVRIVQDVRGIQGTTYFALNEKVDGLYSVVSDEIGEKKRGTVVRFQIGKDGRLGDLVRLSGLPCEAPCFVSLSPDG
jgi:6-phosphogluconolactonase (cycloisomerase 2 family)